MEPTHPPAGTIVVGIDGSASSEGALRWAVGQASLERRPLTLLHALNLLGPGQAALAGPSLMGPPELTDALTAAGRAVLVDASQHVRRLAPRLELYEVLSQADPRNALLSAADSAHMVVLGSRGRGPVASLLLGSVGVAVSKHASCPVVITRPHEKDLVREGVLVGVEGTPHDRPVVELACELASQRAEPLTVLHCFWDARHVRHDDSRVADDETGLEDKRLLLREAVRTMAEKHPDVHPRLELVRGFVDQQLIERSRTTKIVVIGSRRSGFVSLGFSSVAPTVVEHAHGTVALVPLIA